MEFRRRRTDGLAGGVRRSWVGRSPAGRRRSSLRWRLALARRSRWPPGAATTAFGDALLERLRPATASMSAGCGHPARPGDGAVALVAYRGSGERDFWFSVHDSAADGSRCGRPSAWPSSRLAPRLGLDARLRRRLARARRGGGRARARARRPGCRWTPTWRRADALLARERTARLARGAVRSPRRASSPRSTRRRRARRRGALICGPAAATAQCADRRPVPSMPASRRSTRSTPPGAGDTFAAAFVTALREGATLARRPSSACETAAQSVASWARWRRRSRSAALDRSPAAVVASHPDIVVITVRNDITLMTRPTFATLGARGGEPEDRVARDQLGGRSVGRDRRTGGRRDRRARLPAQRPRAVTAAGPDDLYGRPRDRGCGESVLLGDRAGCRASRVGARLTRCTTASARKTPIASTSGALAVPPARRRAPARPRLPRPRLPCARHGRDARRLPRPAAGRDRGGSGS